MTVYGYKHIPSRHTSVVWQHLQDGFGNGFALATGESGRNLTITWAGNSFEISLRLRRVDSNSCSEADAHARAHASFVPPTRATDRRNAVWFDSWPLKDYIQVYAIACTDVWYRSLHFEVYGKLVLTKSQSPE